MSLRRKQPPAEARGCDANNFGGVLLSQGVYPQVPSALTVLTSVFGMGTGVTLSPWPPKICCQWVIPILKTPEQARANF